MDLTPLTLPEYNGDVPDSELARSIAADGGWKGSVTGKIYDNDEVLVANDLDELGRMMRAKGWFVPEDAHGTGVNWRKVPDPELRSAELRR